MGDHIPADADSPAGIPWQQLRPYWSVIVLNFTGDSAELASQQIERAVRVGKRRTPASAMTVVAKTEVSRGGEDDGALGNAGLDEVTGVIYRSEILPGWCSGSPDYSDTRHYLLLVLRRGALVAIHADGPLKDRVETWLDSSPRPQFDKIPPQVLERTLLQGEAKGLWLRGTHPRQSTRPSSKHITGQRLQDALRPSDDASFALGAGRASLPDSADRVAFVGTAGTTPDRSLVWRKRSTDWTDFANTTVELFDMLEGALASTLAGESVYDLLAHEVHDLSPVYGAFDVSTLAPEDLPAASGAGDEVQQAAEILREGILGIHSDRTGTGFALDVGAGGSITGRAGAQVHKEKHGFRISFGPRGTPSVEQPTRAAIDALSAHHATLLTVHYRSGHTFTAGRMWTRNVNVVPFPNWKFENFDGYDITQEKPVGNAQEVHDGIGTSGDRSLFAWVAAQFTEGSLTCDDGPGEIADFLHIDSAGVLTMIHVKAARSAARGRRIAASSYEVVVSQATKNLLYVSDAERLAARLRRAPVARPRSWENGADCDTRHDFIESLKLRDPVDPVRIVIIQPHVHQDAYRRLRDDDHHQKPPSDDFLRLCLLETMLNAGRASAVGSGADLYVIAST